MEEIISEKERQESVQEIVYFVMSESGRDKGDA
jgi:hypothetical protein